MTILQILFWYFYVLTTQIIWAPQSLLPHLGHRGWEYAPLLLSVVSKLMLSMKRTDAHSSYGIFSRGTAQPPYRPTCTIRQAPLPPLRHTPPSLAQEEQTGFCLLFICGGIDKAIFSVLGPARVQPEPCGRRQQRGPWNKKHPPSFNLILNVPSSCNIS